MHVNSLFMYVSYCVYYMHYIMYIVYIYDLACRFVFMVIRFFPTNCEEYFVFFIFFFV